MSASITARYDRARARVALMHRNTLKRLIQHAPVSADARPVMLHADVTIEGRTIRVLAGIEVSGDRRELHVSVSRPDSHGQPTRSVWWEDLVSIRACCWPDTADVVQHLPGTLSGETWIDVGEVWHLYGPVVVP